MRRWITALKWWWLGDISREWMRDQERAEYRNTFHGVAWNWDWMRSRKR
jgi:hypothetical protein